MKYIEHYRPGKETTTQEMVDGMQTRWEKVQELLRYSGTMEHIENLSTEEALPLARQLILLDGTLHSLLSKWGLDHLDPKVITEQEVAAKRQIRREVTK